MGMKNIWKILNIEPTKDVNEIKRAYTALAHQINPEEEPDKYSELHEAYKEAISRARNADIVITPDQDAQQETGSSDADSRFDFSDIKEDYMPENNLAETIVEYIISFRESNYLDSAKGINGLSFSMRMELSISLFYMYLKLAEVTNDVTVWQSFFDEPIVKFCMEYGRFREAILQPFKPDSPHRAKIAGIIEDFLSKSVTPDPYLENAMEVNAKFAEKKKRKLIFLISLMCFLFTVMTVCLFIQIENPLITLFGIVLPMIGMIIIPFAIIITCGSNNR